MVRFAIVVALVALSSCGYSTSFDDCAKIACTAESRCPNGAACPASGVCETASTTCGAVDATTSDVLGSPDGTSTDAHADAHGDAQADAPPSVDAASPVDVMLSENTSLSNGTGDPLQCSPSFPLDAIWVRAFALTDFSGTVGNSVFHASAIHIAIAEGTGSASVILTTYTGTIGASSIPKSSLFGTNYFSATVPVAPNADLVIPVSADIPAGSSFAVYIESTQQPGINLVGANTSGETRPAYYHSGCTSPAFPISASSYDYVIRVEGTYVP